MYRKQKLSSALDFSSGHFDLWKLRYASYVPGDPMTRSQIQQKAEVVINQRSLQKVNAKKLIEFGIIENLGQILQFTSYRADQLPVHPSCMYVIKPFINTLSTIFLINQLPHQSTFSSVKFLIINFIHLWLSLSRLLRLFVLFLIFALLTRT